MLVLSADFAFGAFGMDAPSDTITCKNALRNSIVNLVNNP
jgi:hypothetical protein